MGWVVVVSVAAAAAAGLLGVLVGVLEAELRRVSGCLLRLLQAVAVVAVAPVHAAVAVAAGSDASAAGSAAGAAVGDAVAAAEPAELAGSAVAVGWLEDVVGVEGPRGGQSRRHLGVW